MSIPADILHQTPFDFHTTLEMAPVGIAHVDLDGRLLYLNRKFCEILGHTRDELLKVGIQDITHPDDLASGLDFFERVLNGEIDHYTLEKRYIRKDGQTVWANLNASIVRRADGSPHYVIGVIENIDKIKSTERRLKDTQENLARAESNLNLALEAGGMGAWQWDMRSDQVTWWPGMAKLHGLPADAKLVSIYDYRRFVHPDDVDLISDALSQAAAGVTGQRIEYRVVWSDGSIHWLETHAKVIADEAGKPVLRSGVCIDITQRKRTELDLRFMAQATAELASLTDYQTTLNRVAQFAVPAFADWCAVDILGPDGALHRLAVAHTDPKKVELAYELHRRFPSKADAPKGQWKVIHSGAALYVSEITGDMLASSIKDPEYLRIMGELGLQSYIGAPLKARGKTCGVMSFVTSDSRRRYRPEDLALAEELAHRASIAIENAELYQALQARERELSDIVMQTKQSERALREESRILELLNKAGESIASTLDLQSLLQVITDASTQISGAAFGAFFHNGKTDSGDAYLLYTLSGADPSDFEKFGHPRATTLFGPTFRGEAPIRSDDILDDPRYGRSPPHHGMPMGHLPVRSYLAVPVVSPSHGVHGGLFFGHPDTGVFTERVERLIVGIAAQAAVAIDNARLYEAMQKAAEERKLLLESERSARQEAERVSKMKDEFLAMLAHELRNPLAAIRSAAQFLNVVPVDDPRIKRSSEVISRQVDHTTKLVNDLLDVSRVTRGLVTLKTEVVDLRKIVLEAQEQVRQLILIKKQRLSTWLTSDLAYVKGDPTRLVQIVANVLNNAGRYTPEGGEIDIRLECLGSELELTVRDNGIGITPELMPHVFDLFTQGERSLDRSQGGLGLGLALVKKLVELHGGGITVQSEGRDKGTTVRITMPHSSDLAMLTPQPLPTETGRAVQGGFSVLVVDDNVDAANTMSMLLEVASYAVSVEHSATAALERAASEAPKVLLLDIGLPDMDGYELARRLRRLPQLSDSVLIAVTGYGQEQDVKRAHDAGFAFHMLKPVDIQQLYALLRQIAADYQRVHAHQ